MAKRGEKIVMIDDESGEHYLKEVLYNDSLEAVANVEQFRKACERGVIDGTGKIYFR